MKKIFSAIILLAGALLFIHAAAAQPLLTASGTKALEEATTVTATTANFADTPIQNIIGNVLKIILGLLATIFLALIIVAGFGWMTAQGGEEKVKKSQAAMQSAIVGLIIVLAAYSLTLFILPKIDTTNIGGSDFTKEVAGVAHLSDTPVGNVIANIVKIVLGFLATIFLVLTVLSGFQWMTAGGNEDQIKSAQGRLKNAIIGLVIVLMAYAITYFIFQQLPFGGSLGGPQGGTSG